YCYRNHRHLPSFPTRRSSDLNTSFQLHLQVNPAEFTRAYNVAQLIAAPVLAVGCNSPILFAKRLWRETRIAIFQQTVDTRLDTRSEEHTSELQSRENLVCRLL